MLTKRYRWIAVSTTGVVLVAAAILSWQLRERERASQASAEKRRADEEGQKSQRELALSTALRRVNSRLAALERAQKKRTGGQPGESARAEPDVEVEEQAPEPDEPPKPREPVAAGKVLETYAAKLAGERTDPEWERSFHKALDTAASSDDMKDVSVVDSHCGSTLCRLDLASSDSLEEHRREVVQAVSAALTPHGGIWISNSPLGEKNAVLFVARAGTEGLPRVSP